MTPDEIRATLARLGLPQTGAARLLGVDARTFRRWCSGDPMPELAARVLRMASAGELSLDRLADHASPPRAKP